MKIFDRFPDDADLDSQWKKTFFRPISANLFNREMKTQKI